ncbi:hypothetical protein FRC02_003500 [Tulasnella sp. 418]|nr:hypothetical protein FRC02_003500 [Tulasnella sp. 418]
MSSTTSSPTRSHAPKRSISHKATSFFNRVKDADLAIVEAGQKLASELHHIFVSSPSQEISEPTEAMLTKLAPFGNNEVNLSTPRPSSSLGDLTFLPFQNPCPSSEPCSVATTPLLSPSSLTPRSSCESIRNWKFESLSDIPPLVPPETPEEIPDPWHARPNVDYEAEERRLLCLESARSVFGRTRPAISASPIVNSKHKRSVSAAASSPLSYMSYPEDFSPSAADNDDLELGAVMQNERKRRRRLSRSHSRFNLSSNRPLRMVKSSINFAIQSFSPAPSQPSSPNSTSMPSSPFSRPVTAIRERTPGVTTQPSLPFSTPIAVIPFGLLHEAPRCPSPAAGVKPLSPRVPPLRRVRRSTPSSPRRSMSFERQRLDLSGPLNGH